MLLFRRIEIINFACFEEVAIEPSIDPRKPLTLIRAENGSGKTTLLRAIRWGMYGEKGLPGDDTKQFSLHPAGWHPDKGGVETCVSIRFENDGSSRRHTEGKETNTAYHLKRTVKTISKELSHKDEVDFQRVGETAQLLVQGSDGSWQPHDTGVDSVIAELLPWDLRDFFLMNADEAADYVGGSENKMIQRKDVIDKTSFAVQALLGLDIFEKATHRVQKIAHDFQRDATKIINDNTLNLKQGELNSLRSTESEISQLIESRKGDKSDIEDRLLRARNDLEMMVGRGGANEELKKRLEENRANRVKALKQQHDAVRLLSGELSAIDLLGSLAAREVSYVCKELQPLYDDGSIPIAHLEFVKSLLDKGTCVCGEDLVRSDKHRRCVSDLISRSHQKKEQANHLARVLDAAKALSRYKNGQDWDDRCTEHEANISDLDNYINELDDSKRDIDLKLNAIDDHELQLKRTEIDMLEKQIQNMSKTLTLEEDKLKQIQTKRNELDGIIRGMQRGIREANRLTLCQSTAEMFEKILSVAYITIRDTQVSELGQEMNRLFARMAANVFDDKAEEGNLSKATIRMIAKVGLRPLDDERGKFEIFARNSRGRSMPPTEINGASRRILALSFVLALCKVSGTRAPLIADSLLNFMSGVVRTNTLRVTSKFASQPILLLTGSDLDSQNDVDLLNEFAGVTYTLTGQWQHEDFGGDVMNLTTKKQVSLVCRCGPREYCKICKRKGQAEISGWRFRQYEGL